MNVRSRLALAALLAFVFSGLGVAVPATAAVTTTASSLPGMLTVRSDTHADTYIRDLFQHWIDADYDGCNTRYEVLIAESTTPVTVGSGCSLTGTTWVSPYDNVTWTAASDVDVDHVVPLAEAWRSGAWSWTAQQRKEFANDLDVPYALIAVTDSVNQSKSDRDPALWMPSNTAFQCEYVIDWALVKYRWSLTVDSAEMSALTSTLSGTCGNTAVTLPSQKISTVASGVAEPSGFADGTTRLYGASRYETAIKVSQRYAPGVPAVYVATGTNFPDALSAAAAAAYVGGPLLLTTPTSLPAAVKTEIQRLNPAKIFVIGGTGAVSASVATQLNSIAPVTRYGGADRYATGLQIVNGMFSSSTTAILATGRSFPDALAATGVAGKLNAPVILIDGVKSSLTSATLSTLNSLGVDDVILAGGTGVVSSSIATQLRNKGYTVTRYGGADRYATAALLNNAYFPYGSTDTMFLATGTNFPDALAGAALAGRLGAPLYITTPSCAPKPIHDSVNGLSPSKKAVLGGTAVVSNSAASNTECTSGSGTTPTVDPRYPYCKDLPAGYGPYYKGVDPEYYWYRDADSDGIVCEW